MEAPLSSPTRELSMFGPSAHPPHSKKRREGATVQVAWNLRRYESVGFAVEGAFNLPDGGPTVTTMWREPLP
jgi:hypothetical protein